jgi:class 3 adenylate cyclase
VSIEPRGCQVKTEGDAFMIVFTRPSDAVLFGTDLQLDLLEFPWPDWMLHDEVPKRGLRVVVLYLVRFAYFRLAGLFF